MPEIQLNLIVIRASNVERSVQFYEQLGLRFVKHRHGNGLEHFSSTIGLITFEIYPQTPSALSTAGTRLGFQVRDVSAMMMKLEAVAVITPPIDSEWGLRAVVVDPDGHRVELTQLS
jgi:lactoylglutathione lyase